MSVGVHCLSTLGIYLAALGLPGEAPNLTSHFLIVPLAMLAGALPVSVNGLGVFEGALGVLYKQFGGSVATGTVVGLAYRVMTICIAIIGFGYYLANRAIVRQVMKQVSAEEELPEELENADVEPIEPAEPMTTAAVDHRP
jgi:hypothetical protein